MPTQNNKNLGLRKATETLFVTITPVRRNVDMYHVFGYELENLSTTNTIGSLCLTFLGITIGVAVSLWITIVTVELTNQYVYATFFASAIAFTILSALLGIGVIYTYQSAKSQIKKIKEQAAEIRVNEKFGGE